MHAPFGSSRAPILPMLGTSSRRLFLSDAHDARPVFGSARCPTPAKGYFPCRESSPRTLSEVWRFGSLAERSARKSSSNSLAASVSTDTRRTARSRSCGRTLTFKSLKLCSPTPTRRKRKPSTPSANRSICMSRSRAPANLRDAAQRCCRTRACSRRAPGARDAARAVLSLSATKEALVGAGTGMMARSWCASR
jgi:hypothetical protein